VITREIISAIALTLVSDEGMSQTDSSCSSIQVSLRWSIGSEYSTDTIAKMNAMLPQYVIRREDVGGTASTGDWRSNRINIFVDGSGKIVAITCH
jgi:hypothetical protein